MSELGKPFPETIRSIKFKKTEKQNQHSACEQKKQLARKRNLVQTKIGPRMI